VVDVEAVVLDPQPSSSTAADVSAHTALLTELPGSIVLFLFVVLRLE
jgi:hypothetical protein